MRRALASLALLALLSGCGLRPLYGGGTGSETARLLAGVRVSPIEGKAGWLMRNALNDRLSAMGAGEPRYRLDIVLDDKVEGLGVRPDETVTRERRTLRARYSLTDTASDTVVLDDTAGWDAGIDVASSDYATVVAEDAALERLASIIADRVIARIAVADRP